MAYKRKARKARPLDKEGTAEVVNVKVKPVDMPDVSQSTYKPVDLPGPVFQNPDPGFSEPDWPEVEPEPELEKDGSESIRVKNTSGRKYTFDSLELLPDMEVDFDGIPETDKLRIMHMVNLKVMELIS